MSAAALPVSIRYVHAKVAEPDIEQELLLDLATYYDRITDVRAADLSDLWQLARDLVLAIERWSKRAQEMSGEQKMDLAVDVAWRFFETRGGYAAIKDRVTKCFDRLLPNFIARRLAGWIFSEAVARGFVRLTLEWAVREMRRVGA